MSANNVVLIILDTLRKDYGEKYLNPMLQKFGFIYYPNAISPSPWTLPTHASIFTGMYPSIHGVHETKEKKLPNIRIPKRLTGRFIPTILGELGYKNIFISANEIVQRDFGFEGFSEYYNVFWYPPRRLTNKDITIIRKYGYNTSKWRTALKLVYHRKISVLIKAGVNQVYDNRILATLKRYPKEKGISRGISILKKYTFDKSSPYFIFMNFTEVHEPYTMKYPGLGGLGLTIRGRVDSRLVHEWQKGYPRQTIYLREKLKELLLVLRRKGILNESIVIITSDHGQLLGEDHRVGHGLFLDDELTHVPLWVRFPDSNFHELKDQEPTKYEGYISLVDLHQYILGVTRNGSTESIPLTQSAFSESFGNPNPVPMTEYSPKYSPEKIEKYRIAIYYKNFKGIFNVTDWKFEEVKSYDPNIEVTEDIIKYMKKEVIRFLKTATVAKVPKIKI